jgi:hypothetical protein
MTLRLVGPCEEVSRLIEALGLGRNVTGFHLSFDVGDIPSLTVRRHLSAEEVEALAEWYETEGVLFVEGETTYNLERKEPAGEAAT